MRASSLDSEPNESLVPLSWEHPLRDIPNWPDVPLFHTDDKTKSDAALAWSKAHAGELVREELILATKYDSRRPRHGREDHGALGPS